MTFHCLDKIHNKLNEQSESPEDKSEDLLGERHSDESQAPADQAVAQEILTGEIGAIEMPAEEIQVQGQGGEVSQDYEDDGDDAFDLCSYIVNDEIDP